LTFQSFKEFAKVNKTKQIERHRSKKFNIIIKNIEKFYKNGLWFKDKQTRYSRIASKEFKENIN